MFDSLEPRVLLSMSVSVNKGVLVVGGTSAPDAITIDLSDNLAVISINDANFTIPVKQIKSVKVLAGAGDDRVSVSSAVTFATQLHGGPGNDYLQGGPRSNQLYGEDGNDTLQGGEARDVLSGGKGIDTADYSNRSDRLVISLDGKANDGRPKVAGVAAENDNIMADIENVIGSSNNDKITGNKLPNTLQGGAGNDTLIGLGGNDLLVGGDGADSLDAGDGDDILLAIDAASSDTLNGGTGFDSVAFDSVSGVKDTLLNIENEVSVLER